MIKLVGMKKQEAKQNLEIARIEIENMLKSGEKHQCNSFSQKGWSFKKLFLQKQRGNSTGESSIRKRRTYFKRACRV